MNMIKIAQLAETDKGNCISYPLHDDQLLNSIRQFGILSPVLLVERNGPVVVAGFKRIRAALEAGFENIPCTVLDIDDQTALLTAVCDNLARPLNSVEKARSVRKMADAGLSRDTIMAVMKRMGLPQTDKMIRNLSLADQFHHRLLSFIVSQGLPISAVEQLLLFDDGERIEIIEFLEGLAVTVSHIREILQLLMLLKVKQGGLELNELHKAHGVDQLRNNLKRKLNPILTSIEERYAGLRKTFTLPPHISVRTDPYFEREAIDIQIKARTAEEIAEATEKLNELLERGVFRSIFELTHSGIPDRN
jgi:hypothetical protein